MTNDSAIAAAESLKTKLRSFTESLESEERHLFVSLIDRALGDDDVQGYDWNAFVASLEHDWHNWIYGSDSSLNNYGQAGSMGIGTD
jgi:hypothetical protein